MNRMISKLPLGLTLLVCFVALAYGPIEQPAHYHNFADQSLWLGIPHAADVLSNAGFALVGVWGLLVLRPRRGNAAIQAGWVGYQLFLVGVILTALGSGFYHLAPDNARLVWDRLPIVLACVGLLAAVRAESRKNTNVARDTMLLSILAVASVVWWVITDHRGQGDLRPYLILQLLPLALIPMWQTIYAAPRLDRIWFGVALLLYVFAKAAEVYDHQILASLGVISGHTIKHLLATAAAGVLVARLIHRTDDAAGTALTSSPR